MPSASGRSFPRAAQNRSWTAMPSKGLPISVDLLFLRRNHRCIVRRLVFRLTVNGNFGIRALVRLQLAPALDVGVVIIERRRENVTAGAIGDEIEVLRLPGIGDGFQRVLAWISDRRRRQALD